MGGDRRGAEGDCRHPRQLPAHSVIYVIVQESNNDSVEFATAASFTGMMVAWGCVVWGSGYYYPPDGFYGGGYPIYYPHYPSYGFGALYNPWTGAYRAARSPTVRMAALAWDSATTRAPAPTRAARSPGSVWRARRGPGFQPAHRRLWRDATGLKRLWQLGIHRVQRGDDWAATARYTSNAPGGTTRTTETSEAARPSAAACAPARRLWRAPATATFTPATTATSIARMATAGRGTKAAAGTTSTSRRSSSATRPGRRRRKRASGLGFVDRAAGDARFGGPRRGHAADSRRQRGAQRRVLTRRQLPCERRQGRRRPATVGDRLRDGTILTCRARN